ncbi:hypothetical protein JCM10450v2_003623 [Rhodotorula kratochvilovae]
MPEYTTLANLNYDTTGSTPSSPPSSPLAPDRREIAFPPSREAAVRAACETGLISAVRESTPELADISIETTDLARPSRVEHMAPELDSDDDERVPPKRPRRIAPQAHSESPTPTHKPFLLLHDKGKKRRTTRSQRILEELHEKLEQQAAQIAILTAKQNAVEKRLEDVDAAGVARAKAGAETSEQIKQVEQVVAVHEADLKQLLGEYEIRHQTMLLARFVEALAHQGVITLVPPPADAKHAPGDAPSALTALAAFRAADPVTTNLLLLNAVRCNKLRKQRHAAAHPNTDWASWRRLHGTTLLEAGQLNLQQAMDQYEYLGGVGQRRWKTIERLFEEPTLEEKEAIWRESELAGPWQ